MNTLARFWKSSPVILLALSSVGGSVSLANQSDAPRGAAEQGDLPRVENARIENRTVAGTLSATMAELAKNATEPVWVGYAVTSLAGERTICCGNYSDSNTGWCGKCALETDGEKWSRAKSADGDITLRKDRGADTNEDAMKLEGAQRLVVLFRLQDKRLTRVKVASDECVLDTGGLAFIWLAGVKPAESAAFLGASIREAGADTGERRSIVNEALTAIALHDGPEAEAALESFAAPAQAEELQKQASFWLGAARGKEGLAALQHMAKKDPSPEVRGQVAFALSVSKEPAALGEMIRMAHEDESGHVRGQALFWLAHKAGERAVRAIDAAITSDPDTDVKKQAVFALSQLPKEEGVPKLIQVAENNRNPEVRKQAMFWLGQSQDPRALAFFEKVLLTSSPAAH